MEFLKYILLPFSILYGLITDIRNYLYDNNFWKKTTFNLPVINVGNLTVGGTGKTPHVEYLIKLLKDKYTLATLSRGYGRKTKGFIIANSSATAQTIGDEPYQFYQKFKEQINVVVGEKRVDAISKILTQNPQNEVIILDDAFQHRPIKPSLNLLLMDYSRPIYEDYTFPAGNLRERRHGAKRSDIVIVTKCPDNISFEKQTHIKQKIQPYLNKNIPIFFTKIIYGKPLNCRLEEEIIDLQKVILLSGIANPKPFEAYAKTHFEVVNHLIFRDHHDFIEKDLLEISSNKMPVLMTEKDMVKFIPFLNHNLLKDIPLYYLPIEIGFVDETTEQDFKKMILNHL